MLKNISKHMYEGNFFSRLVMIVLTMISVSLVFYVVYSTIFVLYAVLGLGAFLVSGMLGILLIVVAMIKHPKKQEYSEYARKRM